MSDKTAALNKVIKDYKKEGIIITKQLSDTYHTFGDLYNHRMALNLALVKALVQLQPDGIEVYKSRLHSDGTMFEDMFIVVIDSPHGQISYHYDNPEWDKFSIPEVDQAKEFDGHTPKDCIDRLMDLL